MVLAANPTIKPDYEMIKRYFTTVHGENVTTGAYAKRWQSIQKQRKALEDTLEAGFTKGPTATPADTASLKIELARMSPAKRKADASPRKQRAKKSAVQSEHSTPHSSESD